MKTALITASPKGINSASKCLLEMPIHCNVLEAKYMSEVMAILEEMKVPPHKFVWTIMKLRREFNFNSKLFFYFLDMEK